MPWICSGIRRIMVVVAGALLLALPPIGADVVAAPVQVDADGISISGYDPVSYFREGGPLQGSSDYQRTHEGATFLFSSPENLALFDASPESYVPRYGGNCAFGVALGNLSPVDPLAYSIRDNKLYLMINQATQAMWRKREEKLIPKANSAWRKLSATEQ